MKVRHSLLYYGLLVIHIGVFTKAVPVQHFRFDIDILANSNNKFYSTNFI